MATPSSLMSTISWRSSIAASDFAVKETYAGVWILCRTRRRRLVVTGVNAEFMTAMGKGPSSCGTILTRVCGKVINQENKKDKRVMGPGGVRFADKGVDGTSARQPAGCQRYFDGASLTG